MKMKEQSKQLLIYIFPVVPALVWYLLETTTEETRYHAKQALTIAGIVILLFWLPVIGTLVEILGILCRIFGVVKVLNNDDDPKIPVIGDLAEYVFGKIEAKKSGKTKKVEPEEIKTSKKEED